MSRPLRALAALALAALPAPAAPPTTPDWAFDVLKLKNGVVHKGLLLEDGPGGVRFQIIGRKPGRPTVWLTVAFKKEDVLKLEKLPDDRAGGPQGQAGGDRPVARGRGPAGGQDRPEARRVGRQEGRRPAVRFRLLHTDVGRPGGGRPPGGVPAGERVRRLRPVPPAALPRRGPDRHPGVPVGRGLPEGGARRGRGSRTRRSTTRPPTGSSAGPI